ncbi:hypothetical protein GOBAR_AA27660 [Gossypium barbadense]|uniref:Uncharacterized protein n=1 Tax=Gossypium barbadense TaxID=3634 RepID=A0A2P5WPK9_GOSBA|nr:hypothetical protein GOBAR_AA27660 [Gossypium barbadense]
MLSKFISVSETRFQNTVTTLKNQQASIQGLETQIGQLSKLISKRPQGSSPNDEGVVEPELGSRQENVVRKGQGEVGHNKIKSVIVEYKPRVPYPNARRKDRSDEQFALSQMPNTMKFLKELLANKRKLYEASHVELNAEMSLKKVHEPFSSNSREPIHEDRRLQIEELDEWRTHKPRTPDKPNLRQNKLNTFPNQLKVGDRVLLDAANPHIVTTTPNEEIQLTVLSIFPFSMVKVSHPKFGTFKVNNTRLKPYFDEIDSRNKEYKLLKPPRSFNGEGFPQRHGQAHGRA